MEETQEMQVVEEGGYNYLDDRDMTAVYQEQIEDGRLVKGHSRLTWDDKWVNIELKLSVEMTDERVLDIFQDLLINTVQAMDHERERNGKA